MNKKNLLIASVLVWSFYFTASSSFGQGSLTPPGPPGPTMFTLTQIMTAIQQAEPRTAVNTTNTPGDTNNLFIISQSGSYYLTTNLASTSNQNGIEITANNVTLDLSGFSVQAASGLSNNNYGIYFPSAVNNITVRNGAINGWAIGVNAGGTASASMVFEVLNLSGNSEYGILASNATCVVQNCNFETNGAGVDVNGLVTGCVANNSTIGGIGGSGIICPSFGTVTGCTVDNNSGPGIVVTSGTVAGCTVEGNSSSGIVLYTGSVSGCTVVDNAVYGIYLSPGTASACNVSGTFLSGIYVNGNGSEVIGNTCQGNNTSGSDSFGGISIAANSSRIEDNQVTASGDTGIAVFSAAYSNNIIIRNTVSGNGASDYSVPGGNVVGPIITNSGTITNTSPWANFAF